MGVVKYQIGNDYGCFQVVFVFILPSGINFKIVTEIFHEAVHINDKALFHTSVEFLCNFQFFRGLDQVKEKIAK